MRVNKRNGIWDKLQFIIHALVSAIIYWLALCALPSYENLIIKDIHNNILKTILYIIPYIIIIWFIIIENRKNSWQPFGRASNDIRLFIYIIAIIAISIKFGFPKVLFLK